MSRRTSLLLQAVVGLSLWAGFSGCSSTPAKALPTDGALHDGSLLGRSYPCTGGFIGTVDAGVVPLPADAGASPPVNCVIGQSYCHVESSDDSVGITPGYECRTLEAFVDGASVSIGLGVCADAPTCACLCAHGAFCVTECSCHDDGGFAVVSCHQI